MKIVEINGTNYAATGNIMLNIANQARKEGHEVFTCCKKSKKSQEFKYNSQIYIGTRLERVICEYLCEITGMDCSFNLFGTYIFIKKLKHINPDIIHLHVIHGSYINVSMLFNYIKKYNIPVIWTFHDPWAFTGSCVEFEHVNCFKWRNSCENCQLKKSYPKSLLFDNSSWMHKKKIKMFSNINNMTIITPSKWLANYARQSYLGNYNIEVINNGIDLSRYKKVQSDFRKKYQLNDKYIILGVANGWSESKGLETFIELSRMLSNNFAIVLVGTSEQIDQNLPENIISIHKTYNQEELVKIYSSADLFVNPTKDDNLPTVNIEALACGTPVISYCIGGCPEIINDKSGEVIETDNIEKLKDEIIRICKDKPFKSSDCIKRAHQFDANERCKDYLNVYKRILNK